MPDQLIQKFEEAEANMLLEGLDPRDSPHYQLIKESVIAGKITFDEARKAVLVYHQKQRFDHSI